jgi:hypothetical protein
MSSVAIEKDQEFLLQRIEKIQEKAVALEAQIARLEQEYSRTPDLLRMLGKWLVIGATKEIDWLRFQLKIEHRELEENKAQYEMLSGIVPRFDTVPGPRKAISSFLP